VRLTDLMSNANLDFYPQVALIIFLAVFAGVSLRLFWVNSGKDYEEAARLPLKH